MNTIELLLELLDMFVGFMLRSIGWLAVMGLKLLEIAFVVAFIGGIAALVIWGFWSVGA